jgi:hypothetical protein
MTNDFDCWVNRLGVTNVAFLLLTSSEYKLKNDVEQFLVAWRLKHFISCQAFTYVCRKLSHEGPKA